MNKEQRESTINKKRHITRKISQIETLLEKEDVYWNWDIGLNIKVIRKLVYMTDEDYSKLFNRIKEHMGFIYKNKSGNDFRENIEHCIDCELDGILDYYRRKDNRPTNPYGIEEEMV